MAGPPGKRQGWGRVHRVYEGPPPEAVPLRADGRRTRLGSARDPDRADQDAGGRNGAHGWGIRPDPMTPSSIEDATPSNARRPHQGCQGPSEVRSQNKVFTHHFAGLHLRGSVRGLRGSFRTTRSEREASPSPPRLLLPSCPQQVPRRGGHTTPTVRAASPYRPGVPSMRPVRTGRAVPSMRPVRTGRGCPRSKAGDSALEDFALPQAQKASPAPWASSTGARQPRRQGGSTTVTRTPNSQPGPSSCW